MTDELRRTFHDELAGLRERVEEMAGVVVCGIGEATEALLDGDRAKGARVVARDARIDELYPTIEADVFSLVARQAPVARDLRFLMATSRVAMEIERSGDLISSVARRAGTVDAGSLTPDVRMLLAEMGTEAASMFRAAAACYASLDVETARALPATDDAMDDLHRRFLTRLVDGAGPRNAGAVVDLGLIGRFYERVADHAVVIAERVCFVVDGAMNAGDTDESGY
jgi:phosphate transport system protein